MQVVVVVRVGFERFLLNHRLRVGIHRAVDLQTLGVQLQRSRVLTDVIVFRKVPAEIPVHLVDVPVLYLYVILFVLVIFVLVVPADEGHVGGFFHRLIIFVLRDLALLIHLVEHGLAALLVVLGIVERIPARGVLGDARDRGTFGDRAFTDGLVEVQLGGGFDALTVVTEVDDVQIRFDDIVLAVLAFDVQRAEDLSELSGEGHLAVVGDVLDQLLGQGRAAVVVPAGD